MLRVELEAKARRDLEANQEEMMRIQKQELDALVADMNEAAAEQNK